MRKAIPSIMTLSFSALLSLAASGCDGLWRPYIGTINTFSECAQSVCATGAEGGICAYHKVTTSDRWRVCTGMSCMSPEITKVQSFTCDNMTMQPVAPAIGDQDTGVRTGTSLTNEPLACLPSDNDLIVFQTGTLLVDWAKTPCIWRAESDLNSKHLYRVNLVNPEQPSTYSLTVAQSDKNGLSLGTTSGVESGRWHYTTSSAASLATNDVRFFDSSMKIDFRRFTFLNEAPTDPVCLGSQPGMTNGTCVF